MVSLRSAQDGVPEGALMLSLRLTMRNDQNLARPSQSGWIFVRGSKHLVTTLATIVMIGLPPVAGWGVEPEAKRGILQRCLVSFQANLGMNFLAMPIEAQSFQIPEDREELRDQLEVAFRAAKKDWHFNSLNTLLESWFKDPQIRHAEWFPKLIRSIGVEVNGSRSKERFNVGKWIDQELVGIKSVDSMVELARYLRAAGMSYEQIRVVAKSVSESEGDQVISRNPDPLVEQQSLVVSPLRSFVPNKGNKAWVRLSVENTTWLPKSKKSSVPERKEKESTQDWLGNGVDRPSITYTTQKRRYVLEDEIIKEFIEKRIATIQDLQIDLAKVQMRNRMGDAIVTVPFGADNSKLLTFNFHQFLLNPMVAVTTAEGIALGPSALTQNQKRALLKEVLDFQMKRSEYEGDQTHAEELLALDKKLNEYGYEIDVTGSPIYLSIIPLGEQPHLLSSGVSAERQGSLTAVRLDYFAGPFGSFSERSTEWDDLPLGVRSAYTDHFKIEVMARSLAKRLDLGDFVSIAAIRNGDSRMRHTFSPLAMQWNSIPERIRTLALNLYDKQYDNSSERMSAYWLQSLRELGFLPEDPKN